MKKERHAGIELLRILSMFFVVNVHFLIHGNYLQSDNFFVRNESWLLFIFSIVAVNCYVLITGYFMSDKCFKLSRIVTVYLHVWFYSVALLAIASVIGLISFTKSSLINAVLPLIFNHYWFIREYILLLLVSPLLNAAIRKMGQGEFKYILFGLVSVFSLLNYIIKPLNPIIEPSGGFGLVWFVVMYLTAAYIKKFPDSFRSVKKWLVIYIICSLIVFVIHLFTFGKGEVWEYSMIKEYNNPLIYLAAVALFVVFVNMDIRQNIVKKIILLISPLTLAVYLIHESHFISGWLWETINVNTWCTNNWLFIFQAIGTVLGIFIICCTVEFIRKSIFKLLRIDFAIVKASNFIEAKVKQIIIK